MIYVSRSSNTHPPGRTQPFIFHPQLSPRDFYFPRHLYNFHFNFLKASPRVETSQAHRFFASTCHSFKKYRETFPPSGTEPSSGRERDFFSHAARSSSKRKTHLFHSCGIRKFEKRLQAGRGVSREKISSCSSRSRKRDEGKRERSE